MCVLKVGDHALLYVADPMMRCRWPNSDGPSSGLLGSPFTGSFCHSTLAISVDFRALRASVKLYPRLADKPDAKILRSWAVTLDRKSTRLNSSHSQISYAVFCLKKKKKKKTVVNMLRKSKAQNTSSHIRNSDT